MIARLKGLLIQKSPVFAIIEANGIGYKVHISLPTFYNLPDLGASIVLNIYTHVREDEFKLFGFSNNLEQTVFEKLIGISKVGPKLALTILSGMSVEDFLGAISNKDIARLSTIPGIGAKTAERLALEMKDKLQDFQNKDISMISGEQGNSNFDDALSALVNLGYKKSQVEKALKTVFNLDKGNLEELIKNTLKILS